MYGPYYLPGGFPGGAKFADVVTCVSVAELICPHRLPLCIRCRTPLTGRRLRWCSTECAEWFTKNHDWTQASYEALKLNQAANGGLQTCVLCGSHGSVEIDHIEPLRGGYRAKNCLNHQDNLRVLCHSCHAKVTARQAYERSKAFQRTKAQGVLAA